MGRSRAVAPKHKEQAGAFVGNQDDRSVLIPVMPVRPRNGISIIGPEHKPEKAVSLTNDASKKSPKSEGRHRTRGADSHRDLGQHGGRL